MIKMEEKNKSRLTRKPKANTESEGNGPRHVKAKRENRKILTKIQIRKTDKKKRKKKCPR